MLIVDTLCDSGGVFRMLLFYVYVMLSLSHTATSFGALEIFSHVRELTKEDEIIFFHFYSHHRPFLCSQKDQLEMFETKNLDCEDFFLFY